jgi:hypothetical protein
LEADVDFMESMMGDARRNFELQKMKVELEIRKVQIEEEKIQLAKAANIINANGNDINNLTGASIQNILIKLTQSIERLEQKLN